MAGDMIDDDDDYSIALPRVLTEEEREAIRRAAIMPRPMMDLDPRGMDLLERRARRRRGPEHGALWAELMERRRRLVEQLEEMEQADPDGEGTTAAQAWLARLDRELSGAGRDESEERPPTTERLRELLRDVSGVTRADALEAITRWLTQRTTAGQRRHYRWDATRAVGGGRMPVRVVDHPADVALLQTATTAVQVHTGRRHVDLLEIEEQAREELRRSGSRSKRTDVARRILEMALNE